MGLGIPETRYARNGAAMIAYQVLGEGSFDVVIAPSFVSHVELQWEAAGWAAAYRFASAASLHYRLCAG